MKLLKKKDNKEITDNNSESKAGEKQSDKSYSKTATHVKRSLIAGLLVSAAVIVAAVISTAMPYAITIDGDVLCYVRDKEKAGKVTQAIIEEYLPEGTDLQAVEMQGDFTVDTVDVKTALTADCVPVKEAITIVKSRLENPDEFAATEEGKSVKAVSAANKAVDDLIVKAEASDGNQADTKTADVKADEDSPSKEEAEASENDLEGEEPAIAILSTGEVTEDFEAEIKYEKDDSMLAGESEIVSEGKKGVRNVLRQYNTVNGEVVSTKDLEVETIEEAEPKVIKKGTLGLPDGEDWKTYEGDPIFNDGEALIKTALNYLGAPYKYGGHSLTTGIDCVQFVRQMYAKYGIKLPNGRGINNVGTAVSLANAQPGDIICYSNHYALYMGDNKIVHATSKGGVKVRNNAQFRKIVTIRRIPRN